MAGEKVNQALRLIKRSELDREVLAFLADCEARNLSAHTIRIYRHHLRRFAEWAGDRPLQGISPADLRAYFLALKERHNPGGQHQAFRVLRTFFRWLVSEGVIERSPFERLKPPKLPQEPLEPIPLAVIEALLRTCDHSEAGLRDRAVILTLLDTGLRASEVIALAIGDFDPASGALVIRQGKGRKGRVVFVGAQARKAVLAYLRTRPQAGADDPLFASLRTGERLTYQGLREVIRRRAKSAGVRPPALHAFRRSFALLSLANGMDVFTLQKLMGHSDLGVLRRYLKQTQEHLREAHAEHGPVDRLLKAAGKR